MNQSSEHENVIQKLHQLIEQVVDTASTFDDRISFTPITSDGICRLIFTGPNIQKVVTIFASVKENSNVLVIFDSSIPPLSKKAYIVAYSGVFDINAIYHHVGTHIAKWYGHIIHQQALN